MIVSSEFPQGTMTCAYHLVLVILNYGWQEWVRGLEDRNLVLVVQEVFTITRYCNVALGDEANSSINNSGRCKQGPVHCPHRGGDHVWLAGWLWRTMSVRSILV